MTSLPARAAHLIAEVTEASIAEMVHAFYREVRKDAVLGPVFNTAIAEAAWPGHLDTMCRFWSAVMLTSGRYNGNPVAKHRAIAAIEQPMFDRWLALWEETASALFIAPIAAEFVLKATRIGTSLQMAIFRRLPARRRLVKAQASSTPS
ncbi:MAG: group III truncated hemoglobin [Acetobacteraceae bacterium]